MTAKELKEIQRKHDKIMSTMSSYAHHAYRWDMRKEDDYNGFKEMILDILLESGAK